jgi:hypothetical protein
VHFLQGREATEHTVRRKRSLGTVGSAAHRGRDLKTLPPRCYQTKLATAVTMVPSRSSGEVGIDPNLARLCRVSGHTPLPRDRLGSKKIAIYEEDGGSRSGPVTEGHRRSPKPKCRTDIDIDIDIGIDIDIDIVH